MSQRNDILQQIAMLRNFCPSAHTDYELTDCLRQCGYNIERAAERLITGKYQAGKVLVQSPPQPSRISTSSRRHEKIVSRSQPNRLSLVGSSTSKKVAPLSQTRSNAKAVASSRRRPKQHATLKTPATKHQPQQSNSANNSWILCQRWLSDAICTTKLGRTDYQEVLALEPTHTGVPRFRGRGMQGKLPDFTGPILTPLLHLRVIQLQATALMACNAMPIGAHIPISLTVRVPDPPALFGLFDDHGEDTKKASSRFFEQQHVQQQTHNNKRNKLLTPAQAAFELLQWAEYGNVPDFTPPQDSSDPSLQEAEELLQEDDFEEQESSQQQPQELVEATEWSAGLPEQDEPAGLNGVTLRPYQKQALHWMLQRERGAAHREQLEEQLSLLSELAAPPESSNHKSAATPKEEGIICECGPVQVGPSACARSRTVDGDLNPVNHPLWKRRFLASGDMKETISFYVNEVLGVATHHVPEPPKPCSGGILADSMGCKWVAVQ